jgi:hypothetical protein
VCHLQLLYSSIARLCNQAQLLQALEYLLHLVRSISSVRFAISTSMQSASSRGQAWLQQVLICFAVGSPAIDTVHVCMCTYTADTSRGLAVLKRPALCWSSGLGVTQYVLANNDSHIEKCSLTHSPLCAHTAAITTACACNTCLV